MKKGSGKVRGNACDSLEGVKKHRDAQRLEAIREALPPWTQDERDVAASQIPTKQGTFGGTAVPPTCRVRSSVTAVGCVRLWCVRWGTAVTLFWHCILEAVLQDWRPHVLPWEHEMVFDEPEEEDDDELEDS